VPEEIRKEFIDIQFSFPTYRAFLKHPSWNVYSKSSDKLTRLYTRVSDRNLLCL